MATSLKNLNEYSAQDMGDISGKKFGIIVSEYNPKITESLCRATIETLWKEGVSKENIYRKNVPGAYELIMGAHLMAQEESLDAVICLGCVIQGETKHFDFICDAVSHGLYQVGFKFNKPIIFGLLTPNTLQQALDRAGGKHGNKGVEAAVAAIKMLNFWVSNSFILVKCCNKMVLATCTICSNYYKGLKPPCYCFFLKINNTKFIFITIQLKVDDKIKITKSTIADVDKTCCIYTKI